MSWTEIETSTHQDHVIKHVIGATVLGWFVIGDAAHFLLDIGLLWTIYVDGEMNLLPQGVALADLEGDDLTLADRIELAFDAQLLLSQGRDAEGLKRFTATDVDCLIESVEIHSADSRRRIFIRGEAAQVIVDTSLDDGQVRVSTV